MKIYQFVSVCLVFLLTLIVVVSCSVDNEELITNTDTLDETIELRKSDDSGPEPQFLAYHYKAACIEEGGDKHNIDMYFKTRKDCTCFRDKWSAQNCNINVAGSLKVDKDCVRTSYEGTLFNILCGN